MHSQVGVWRIPSNSIRKLQIQRRRNCWATDFYGMHALKNICECLIAHEHMVIEKVAHVYEFAERYEPAYSTTNHQLTNQLLTTAASPLKTVSINQNTSTTSDHHLSKRSTTNRRLEPWPLVQSHRPVTTKGQEKHCHQQKYVGYRSESEPHTF